MKKQKIAFGPGAASLILIAVVLALSVLTVLTMISARNDAFAARKPDRKPTACSHRRNGRWRSWTPSSYPPGRKTRTRRRISPRRRNGCLKGCAWRAIRFSGRKKRKTGYWNAPYA